MSRDITIDVSMTMRRGKEGFIQYWHSNRSDHKNFLGWYGRICRHLHLLLS